MSLLETLLVRVISFTFVLLAFSLPTNGLLTGLLNSTIPPSPSTSEVPVSSTPFLNANVTNPVLATVLSEESVAQVHETACPSVIAAIASAVSTVICSSPISIPGLTFPYCNTYTTYVFPKSIYPPASCCNACSIQVPRVQVNYWAPEANSTTQAPKTPYTLVSDGYTFTSPSVYVVYKDLYAQGDCTYYEQGQIGNNVSDATIAYDPDALSTAPCVQSGETEFIGYEPINYVDWYNHVPNSVVETQPGCDIPNTHGINPAGTDLAANPMFSLPPGLSSLEPIWSSYGCQPNGRFPGFDPPRVLTKTSALAPGVQHPASQSAAPTPAAQLSPPIVAPTTANNAQPTLEAGIPDPKSVNADPKAGALIPGSAISDPHSTPAPQDAHPDPLKNDPAAAINPPAAGNSASAEVASQPLRNSDTANQGLGPGSSQDTGKDSPNAAPIPKQAFTIGNDVFTANSASQYVVNGQTITPGAPFVTISGTPLSLDASTKNLIIGTNTIPLEQQPSPSALPSFTLGNQLITPDSASHYIIASQTLHPGAPAITISNTPISLAPSSAYIALGTSTTIPLPPFAAPAPTILVNGQTITLNSASQFLINGHVITPGAPVVTIDGTPISLPADFFQPSFTIPSPAYPYAVDPAGDIVIASQTLVPGGAAITVAGERVSEGADRSDVVVASGKAVTTEGLAGFIAGALGKTAAVGGSGGVSGNGSFGEGQMFTGGAGERDGGMGLFGGVVGVVLLAVVGRGIA